MPPPPAPGPGASPPVERGATTPAAQAAASALLALSRAARSFVLYDPSNAVVRQLLADYQARMRAAVDAHGAMAVDVRPYELSLRGEVVYKDLDREKSLAFRLYRDGIRRLTVLPTVVVGELMRLLEILAVRFTGVRQGEDDAVTLLRRAELRGIQLEAVEGYVPDEENPEPPAGEGEVERGEAYRPPPGWDLPLPPLPQPGPLAWRDVPEAALEPLRPAGDDAEVAALALSVARDLMAEAGRAGWPVPSPELTGFLAEVRDALLASGALAALRQLVDMLGEAGGATLRDELLRGLGDARTLGLVLEAVPEDAARLPADLIPFLPLLGIGATLDALADPQSTEARRRLLLQIVLSRLPREADAVMARLSSLEPKLARELARGLAARAPERASDVARQLLALRDEALRLEGLGVLERADGELPLRPVAALLQDASEAVRVRTAEVLERRGDAAALEPLQAALEQASSPGDREAAALGRALAAVAPIPAARLFAGWLEPKGRFLRGLSTQQRTLQWAAVAGTGALPGAGAVTALEGLASRAEGELRQHCQETLARRRKEQRDASSR